MSSEREFKLYYNTHHNWDWVIDEAVCHACVSPSVSFTKLSKFKELPSQKNSTSKATYSLLRVDITNKQQNCIVQVRITSMCFAYLDPKDSLYREMAECDISQCMPKTFLINWDNEVEIAETSFPSKPSLLKAALGSGGFGLYFVYSPLDVVEVVKSHKSRAEKVDGFLDGLRRDYVEIPQWCLQEIIPSVRVISNDNRRCQIRAYVVECNGKLFLYDTYEVRMPLWDVDLDTVLLNELTEFEHRTEITSTLGRWSDDVENECCGAGHARPYNEQRNKSKTERYLLSEIAELNNTTVIDTIHNTLKVALSGMKNRILSRHNSTQSINSTTINENMREVDVVPAIMAIAGIDLLVSRDGTNDSYKAHIVEFNNNPAMPSPHKHMSALYRQHLVDFVESVIMLGLSAATSDCSSATTEEEFDCLVDRSCVDRFELI